MMLEQQTSLQKLRQQQQDQISSGGSQAQIKLKNPRDHSAKATHSEIARDPIYRTSFTIGQRLSNWLFNCFKCNDAQNSYVQTLGQVQRRHPITISEQYKKIFQDKIVKLKIIETSRLQLNPNVMHPFVKVHIIDKNTGCYLRRNYQSTQPMVFHSQSITFYDQVERRYDSSQNDIVLPFATSCTDFRELGDSKGLWNQRFYLNFPAINFFSENTLILFEILDFNHQALTYKDTDIFGKDNFFKVAWAYLRPVGVSKIHVGKSKLQLFRYKFNSQNAEQSVNKVHIPSVYYDFIWNNHEKYDGFLTVQLNYCAKPRLRFKQQSLDFPNHLFQDDRPDRRYIQRFTGQIEAQDIRQGPKFNEKMLKFERSRQVCQIPKELIYKLQSNKLGCYRAIFIGNKVFAACSNKKYTSIKVYSLQNGEQVMNLKGHRQMIYSMTYSQNQKYLVTGGSDFIVRVWEIPDDVGQFIDEDQSDNYVRGECVHSAAVYSISVIHIPLQDKIFVLTCCYDGFIRLWQVDLNERTAKISRQILINNYQRSPQKVYPTASAVSDSNYFIVGDSLGDIRIFDFGSQSLNLRSLMSHQQLKNDVVVNLKIINKNHLIIQSGDNLIRHFEISNNRLKPIDKYVGANFQTMMSLCSVSPDNKYILAPSQSGKPFLWDIFTGVQISLDHLNLDIKGPLSVCDWHPKYNLILFSGFVEYCPIFIYGNILSQAECKIVSAQQAS